MRSKKGVMGAGLMVVVAALLVMAVGASAAFARSEFKWTKTPLSFTGKAGAVTLESESGAVVTCEKSSSVGDLGSATKLEMGVTYEGNCKLVDTNGAINESCPTTTTKELVVEPGEKLGGGTKVGLYFKPASGDVIAEFHCGSAEVKVMGSFACESTPIGTIVTNLGVLCQKTGSGEQEFKTIEIDGKTVNAELKMESTGIFKVVEKVALVSTETLTFSSEIEQTA